MDTFHTARLTFTRAYWPCLAMLSALALGCEDSDSNTSGSTAPRSSPTPGATISQAPPTDDARAITAVIDEDMRLSVAFQLAVRAGEQSPLVIILDTYEAMAAIDLTQCPQDFASSYSSHVDAWGKLIYAISETDDTEAVSRQIARAYSTGSASALQSIARQSPDIFEIHQEITETALQYLSIAQRYGAANNFIITNQ